MVDTEQSDVLETSSHKFFAGAIFGMIVPGWAFGYTCKCQYVHNVCPYFREAQVSRVRLVAPEPPELWAPLDPRESRETRGPLVALDRRV